MAKVTYVLRNSANKSKAQPISMMFRHGNLQLKFSTGFRIKPQYWNKKKCRVKTVIKAKNKDYINNRLNDLEAAVLRFAFGLIEKKQKITNESVKDFLVEYARPKPTVTIQGKETKRDSLFSFIQSFIDKAATKILPDTGKPVHSRTIQKYNTCLNVLLEFDKQQKRKVDFESIDLQFYNDFVTFLQEKDLSSNTIGKYIQTLKTFLNDATLEGMNTNLCFKRREFKVLKEESESIYLTETELDIIYKLDLSDCKRLEKVRDLFLIGAWIGQRWADFIKIETSDIDTEKGHIRVKQQKTGLVVYPPILPVTKAILEKYDNHLPKPPTNQKFNQYIKEVCQKAGINKTVVKSQTKGGERVNKVCEKWQLVSTHTARRSFATNMYQSGVNTMSIMEVTGHKTETEFMKYIKITAREHSRILKTEWEKPKNHLKVI